MSETNKDLMTPGQRDALEKAYSLLGEHFDHALIVTGFDAADDAGQELNKVNWHGGAMAALGMAEFAKHHILLSDSAQELAP